MTSKPRYWSVAFPLYVSLLTVSPEDKFSAHWFSAVETAVAKLKVRFSTRSSSFRPFRTLSSFFDLPSLVSLRFRIEVIETSFSTQPYVYSGSTPFDAMRAPTEPQSGWTLSFDFGSQLVDDTSLRQKGLTLPTSSCFTSFSFATSTTDEISSTTSYEARL